MGSVCERCGYSSDLPEFFREEPAATGHRVAILCEGCVPAPPPPMALRLLGYGYFFCVTALLVAASMSLVSHPWGAVPLLLAAAFALLGLPFALVVHETGHAVFALLVGRRPVRVVLGRGPARAVWSLGPLNFELRRRLLSGITHAPPLERGSSRVGQAVIVVAGPAANAAAALLGFWTCVTVAGHAIGDQVSAAAFGLAMAQAFMALSNLVPHQTANGPSDGLQLWQLLTHWRRFTEEEIQVARANALGLAGELEAAVGASLRAVAVAPESPIATGTAMHWMSRNQSDAAAIAWFLERRFDLDAQAANPDCVFSLAFLRANIAWSALKAERSDLWDQVERCSELAFFAAPALSWAQATRGAWLVENGDLASGVPLLTRGMRLTYDLLDKADICLFMSKAMRELKDESRAVAYEELRAHYRLSAGG